MSNSLINLIDRSQLGQLNGQYDHLAPTRQQGQLATAEEYKLAIQGKMTQATKDRPCNHCGKTRYCMHGTIKDLCHGTTVPATGWELDTKQPTTGEGVYFKRLPDGVYRKTKVVQPFHAPTLEVIVNKAAGSIQDATYRSILNRSTLTTDQISFLKSRGLTDESIDLAAQKQWVGNWRGGEGFNPHVYGIDATGTISGVGGLFISAMRGEQILGGQVRPTSHILHDLGRGKKPDIPKYLALAKADKQSKLSPKTVDTGETPFTSYADPIVNRVFVVEGYAKALFLYLILHQWGFQNIMVIGTVGSNWGQEELRIHLSKFARKNSEVIMLPDGGAINNSGVTLAIAKATYRLANLGYQMKLGWWGQETKGGNDPDEISQAVFRSMSILVWQQSIFGDKITKALESIGIKGFGKLDIVDLLDSHKPEIEKVSLCGEELAEFLNAISIMRPQIRLIINRMGTGTGKSHASPQVEGSVFLVTNDPHNPGTKDIAKVFVKRASRNGERYLSATEFNGADLAKNEAKYTKDCLPIRPTCQRSEELGLTHEAGLEESPCSDCPFRGPCSKDGYLAKFEASNMAPKQILHPNSLLDVSRDSTERYIEIIIIFDDVDVLMPIEHRIPLSRIKALVKNLEVLPFLSQQSKDFYRALLKICEEGRDSDYGLDPAAASKILPQWKDLPIKDLKYIQSIENNLELEYEGQDVRLDTGRKIIGEDGKPFWTKGENNGWEARLVAAAAEENRIESLKQAFGEGRVGSILNVLFKSEKTVVSSSPDGELVLSRLNERVIHALHSAKLSVVNDATGQPPELYMKALNLRADQILIIESPPSANTNTEFVLVNGLPKLNKISGDRVNDSIYQIITELAKTKEAGKVGAFTPGWIGSEHQEMLRENGVVLGSNFYHSRGSNSYLKCTDIMGTSNFKLNRGALAVRYALIFEEHVDTSIAPGTHPNSRWKKFCLDSQVSEIIQSIGRFRAGRRAGETLRYWQLAELSPAVVKALRLKCPGVQFIAEHGCDMPGWIPSNTQANQIKLGKHLFEGMNLEEKFSLAQIAKGADVTVDVVRGYFTRFGEKTTLRQKLIEIKDSEMTHLNSVLLGLPALPVYDEAELDGYLSEQTKAAIANDLEARSKGAESFLKSKNHVFRLAQEIFEPLYPGKFAQIFLGEAPPITDDPDWEVEIPIDHILDKQSSTTRTEPPIAA
jgi:hypothetical protein